MAGNNKRRESNKIPHGFVVRAQVPMIMTFDEKNVEYIGEHLGEAIGKAYELYHFFDMPLDDENDPFNEGE